MCGVLGLVAAGYAVAQTYPAKPLRFIVPFPPGGSADAIARIIGQQLSAQLSQPVVIDNRAGAETMIGTDAIAKAPPDGYTVGLSVGSALTILPHTRKQLPYDPFRDFIHVAQICYAPIALAVSSSLPANNVEELLALARARPGQLTYASSNEAARIAAEQFKLVTGTDFPHVPYKGAGPAISDVMGGQVTMIFTALGSVASLTKGGKLKTLAVSGNRRASTLPAVPTLEEAGIRDVEGNLAFGVSVPRGVPLAVVQRLNAETMSALGNKEVVDRLAAQGAEPAAGTSQQYTDLLRAQSERYLALLTRFGLKQE